MRAIIQHGGDGTAHLAKQVFLHNHEGHTCHTQVLLSTAIDETILANIQWT